jgi:hypothetical protein
MKKHIWKFIIVSLVILNVIFISALYFKSNGDKNQTQSSTETNERVSPDVNNTISIAGKKMTIHATTTLPEGTNVKYNLWFLDKNEVKTNIEKVVTVHNNSLSCVINLKASLKAQEMTLNTEVFFNTMEQPVNVKNVLGDKGQYLTGSNVKILGDYNALLFQDRITYPDEKTYIASLTTEDQIKAAITKAVTGLDGIEIYKRNGKYAVEATYDLKDGLGLQSAAEKVARDFTFAAYATDLPILRTSIIINKPDGIVGLTLSVGNNQASTQPVSTWTDDKIGPTVFITWVQQNSNKDYKNIENHTAIKDNF